MSKNYTRQIELDALNSGGTTPRMIIQNEFDKFKIRSDQKKTKRTKQIISFVLLLIVSSTFIIYFPKISFFFKDKFAYYSTSKIIHTLNTFGYEIKASSISNIPIKSFSVFSFTDDTTLNDNVKYAYMVHKYNNDFYGKSYGLSLTDEKRIYSWIALNGFNENDLCALNKPLSGENDISQFDWLLERGLNGEEFGKYNNPIFRELLQTRELYDNEYQKELLKPFNNEQVQILRNLCKEQDINVNSSQKVIIASMDFISDHPIILEKLVYYKTKIKEINEELNIRLGLLNLAIAKDFRFSGNYQYYGWFRNGLAGAKMLKSNYAPTSGVSMLRELKSSYNAYAESYADTKILYKYIDLNYYNINIKNPIRIGLKVKDVGLFGVRRKTGEGYIYEHKGIDLIAEKGTPVYPVRDGYIIFAGNTNNGHGNHIIIWHDNDMTSTYSHLHTDEFFKSTVANFEKDGPYWVGTGQQVASVGDSGNIPVNDPQYGYAHLHLEVKENNQNKNPFLLFHQNFKVIH